MPKYQTFTPGKYLEWEKKMVEERLELAANGPPPGYLKKTWVVSDFEALQHNRKWDPWNPLFNDKEYAQKAGYPNLPTYPLFIGLPYLYILKVTVPEDFTEVVYYGHGPSDQEMPAPIFVGDTLTRETEKIIFEDVTIPGGETRHFRNAAVVRTVNQRGEVVDRHTLWRAQGYKKIIDGSDPPMPEQPEDPPAHYTTDDEWQYIMELWDKEYIRGKKPLYWEDVKIGDEPTWTCYGPITYLDTARWHHEWIDDDPRPRIRGWMKTGFDVHITKDRFGSLLAGVARLYGGANIPGKRATCANDTCATLITRAVTNYIGDAGRVTRVRWILSLGTKPPSPERQDFVSRNPLEDGVFLNKVPYMKGKRITAHPYETDTVIAKGYVTDKYINENGDHMIDLVCWGETLDRRIILVVPISAKLPSKKNP